MKLGTPLVVLGAGGYAAEVVEAAEAAGWNVTGLYDDNAAKVGAVVMGRRCAGPISEFESGAASAYVIAIGSNQARKAVAERLHGGKHHPVVIAHPSAVVSRTAVVDPGAYIGAGVFVGPQARVGAHAIVNVGASVGHDAQLDAYTQLCPGARVSGFATVGLGAFMGSNAVIGPSAQMGDWSKLAANSFAARSVPSGALALGVPARVVSA